MMSAKCSWGLLSFFVLSIFLCVGFAAPVFAGEYEEAVMAYRSGKYQESFDLLLKSIDKNPNNPEAYYVMGLTCQQMGKFVEARGYYQFIVDHFPKSKAFALASKGAQSLAHVRAPIAARPEATKHNTTINVYGRSKLEATPGGDEIPDLERVPYTKNHGNLMFVQGFVNGHPMTMLVDTGFFKTTFGKNHLKSLGVKIPEGPPVGQFQGADSRLHDYWETNVSISLGRLKLNVPIAVMDYMGMDPVIGQSFLEKVGYTLDHSASYISFFSKNKKASVAVLPQDSYTIPFRWVNKAMIVEGKVNNINLEMQFDTGASNCVFSTNIARQLGALRAVSDVRLAASQAVGGSISINYEFEIDTLEVGPVRKHHVVVWVSDNASGYPLIGQSFFGTSKYVIDNDAMVIRFSR